MRNSHRGMNNAWVAAMLFYVASGCAIAADAVVGMVVAVRGNVYVEASGSPQPLVVNASVRTGDAIVSRDGKAKIALDDGSIVSVGENTRVRIELLEHSRGFLRARLAIVSGVLRLLVAKVAPDGNFEIESETAIAAVRGTDWVVDATPDQTSVAVLSGKVAVSGRGAAAASTVLLALPGHGTDVRRGSPPTPPIPWGPRRLADVLARATFQ
jgi:hypothetical protein